MSWEWRIFWSGHKGDFWASQGQTAEFESLLANAKADKRPDYYYNLQNETYGLKERWVPQKLPKLELKLRGETRGELENWNKCISEELPANTKESTGLAAAEIERFLDSNRGDLQGPQRAAVDSILQRLAKHSASIERVRVGKDRRQFRGIPKGNSWAFQVDYTDESSAIIFELANLVISTSTSTNPNLFTTVCVEGRDPSSVARFVDEFIGKGEGQIMAYPQFIAHSAL